MNPLRTGLMVFIVMIGMSVWFLPVARAENVTPVATPFITIDPIGNHSLNDVLLINGTTNLPVSNDSVHFSTFSAFFNPGGFGSSFSSNVSIQSGENGVNFWSVNATADRWITQFGRSQIPGNVSPDEFVAAVWLYKDSNVSDSQLFFLLPSGSKIPPRYKPPVASFAFSGNRTIEPYDMAPLAIQFTDTSVNSPTSWLWSFGDGSSSTSQNPPHTYTSAGTYRVTFTATNAAGSNTTWLSVNLPTPMATPVIITTHETPLQVASPVASSTRQDTLLPMIVWPLHNKELSKKISTVHFGPSKDFTDYINAPSITGIQKIDALMIASTSTPNSYLSSAANAAATHKNFGDYLRSSHGPITIEWAYPYTGNVRLSMPVGSLSSNEYGLAYALVNIDNMSILSEGFVDWHNYWQG